MMTRFLAAIRTERYINRIFGVGPHRYLVEALFFAGLFYAVLRP